MPRHGHALRRWPPEHDGRYRLLESVVYDEPHAHARPLLDQSATYVSRFDELELLPNFDLIHLAALVDEWIPLRLVGLQSRSHSDGAATILRGEHGQPA